jgi:hypothetical protein
LNRQDRALQAELTAYQRKKLNCKPGSLRITQKSGKYITQIALEMDEEKSKTSNSK